MNSILLDNRAVGSSTLSHLSDISLRVTNPIKDLPTSNSDLDINGLH